MFDVNDRDVLRRIINNKKANNILIPLYVKVFNRIYGITELDNILEFSKFNFKIGFGSMNNIYTNQETKFPLDQLQCFYNPILFNYFDEETQINNVYVMFESDYIDPKERTDIDTRVITEINLYVNALSEYIDTHVSKLKKERIQDMMNQYSEE